MKVIQPLKLDIDFYDVVLVVAAVAGQERAGSSRGCLGSYFKAWGSLKPRAFYFTEICKKSKSPVFIHYKIGPQYLIPMGGGGVTFGTWDPSDMWSEWCLLSWQKRQNYKCKKDINQLKSLYDLRFMLHKLLCPQFCVWFAVFTKVSATC